MKQLRQLQEDRIRTLPVKGQIIENYPAHINHQLQYSRQTDRVERGFVYRRQTTGSRISYKDYSGELALDSKIGAHSLGFLLAGPVWEKGPYVLSVQGLAMIHFSRLLYTDQLTIGEVSSTSELSLYSRGLALEPGIRFNRSLGKDFFVGAEGGLHVNVYNEDFHLSGRRHRKAANVRGETFRPNWSGGRLSLIVGIKL